MDARKSGSGAGNDIYYEKNVEKITNLLPAQIAAYQKQIATHRKLLEQSMPSRRPHVMIVEDQPFLRGLLTETLTKTCKISACASAEEAWAFYVKETPDVSFLDVGLPGTNGHVLAGLIKELDPLSYVVMITASRYLEDIEAAKKNHVDGFIAKPFSKQKVDECIELYRAARKLRNTGWET
jgi:DNA-binding NtrC family response regulator